MPLQSSAVGTVLKSPAITIPTRWLLAYAAVLGLDDERYADDARVGGIEAIPFICTRFEWLLQRQLRVHPALGLNDDEACRGVHYIQDSTFFSSIRPDMTVEVEGEIREIRGVRAGALIRYAYGLRNLDTGADLVRTRSISIYRDVAVEGNAAKLPETPMPNECGQRVDLGDSDRTGVQVSRSFPQLYTECADIWNPIHTERRVALAAGLPDLIVHGTATWALTGCQLMRSYETRWGKRLSQFAAKFSGNVIPPSELLIRHAPVAEQTGIVHFDVLGPDGLSVLRDGLAVFDRCAAPNRTPK